MDEPRRNYLVSQIETLRAEERRLLALLNQTRVQLGEAEGSLHSVGRAADPTTPARAVASEAQWRETIRSLGTFTVSELAAELGCKQATARKHLDALIASERVVPAGRVLGKAVYEYARPTEPGPAFEAQRRLQSVPTPEAQAQAMATEAPVRGTVAGISQRHDSHMIPNKVVRAAVAEAEGRGWRIKRKGDGHFVLVKGARRVPVAGTPSNPEGAADIIRRMTRERVSA